MLWMSYGNSYLHRTLCHAEGIVTTVKGARDLVLEKYMIPGGSSGFYKRDGYTFDVGSSVMFGFSDKVPLRLIIFNFPI